MTQGAGLKLAVMRNNPARLATLKQLAILDTAPEVVFDDLTRTVAQAFGVPIAMVNLLDADRDWFKSCLGLPMGESPAETSFCEVFLTSQQDIVIVEDTTKDPRFANHPLVVGPPEVRFYAAARLVVHGDTVGTLCVYDTVPKQVSKEQIEQLEVLSKAAVESLASRTGLY
ncbi:MAG: GAF domain-containing protein [Pseudomonadota bacterium]